MSEHDVTLLGEVAIALFTALNSFFIYRARAVASSTNAIVMRTESNMTELHDCVNALHERADALLGPSEAHASPPGAPRSPARSAERAA